MHARRFIADEHNSLDRLDIRAGLRRDLERIKAHFEGTTGGEAT